MHCFFFNDTATTEIYTLSLHDALPISSSPAPGRPRRADGAPPARAAGCRSRAPTPGAAAAPGSGAARATGRSEEHTSELQSRQYLVCRLLLEKKNTTDSHDTDKRIVLA